MSTGSAAHQNEMSNPAMADNTTTGYLQSLNIIWVNSVDSPEFTHLCWALTHSSVVALDTEWKPVRNYRQQQDFPGFPTVSLLQIACRTSGIFSSGAVGNLSGGEDGLPVFLVDLQSIPFASFYTVLKEMFEAPNILKLGFRFKQDLVYLSSTFCSRGCEPGFDKVEPFLDIASLHHLMQPRQLGRRASKDAKSLSTICSELLGICLSKELQCSDWSLRPLSDEQKMYAAIDAHSLLEILNVFQAKIDIEGNPSDDLADKLSLSLGLKEIHNIQKSTKSDVILCKKNYEAPDMIKCGTTSEDPVASLPMSKMSCPIDPSLMKIIKKYSTKLLLQEEDRKPRTSRKKVKKRANMGVHAKVKSLEVFQEWQGPPPWDFSVGGDGSPKFLCDVMVEGLAKHLRCVGIDAAIPSSKRPESRELIGQANKEKRVLLTRDAKLLRYEYLMQNQIYRVKALLKNDQLVEIIETFQLRISEDQLMSRCTKCNGKFIQKPLSTEEAVEAAKGFQKIPDCLFNKNIEFWQCMDCNQLYWEGTQYHNAVQKFIDVCKLNE